MVEQAPARRRFLTIPSAHSCPTTSLLPSDLPHIADQMGSPADDIYRTVLAIFAEEGRQAMRRRARRPG